MPTIYKSQNEKEIFNPFGPPLGYFRLPSDVIDNMNQLMNKKLEDFSNFLVGKVSQELKFDKEIINYIGSKIVNHAVEYHNKALERNNFNSSVQSNPKLQINAGWFIRQFNGEYNPNHFHSGCTLSSVGYLSLPENIEKEWEEDYKDHHPSHGHINFTYGTHTQYNISSIMIKPQVGDFYIFPASLYHCVYPFYTSGERRSFSINMTVI